MSEFYSTSFKDKKVILRLDLNTPLYLKNSLVSIADDSRIIASLPTIKKLVNDGAKILIISHLGRPSGFKDSDTLSLDPIAKYIDKLLNTKVFFYRKSKIDDPVVSKRINNLKSGEIFIFENIRFYKEEILGDRIFAEKLSKYGDVYINDAFGTSHRNHASTSIIAGFIKNKYFGLLLEKEILAIERALKKPKRALTAIVGGAKVSSKIDVISNLVGHVDNLIIGGGMAYTFIKALGGEIGLSICEKNKINTAKRIIESSMISGTKLILPVDSVNSKSLDSTDIMCSDIYDIPNNYMGLDIGPKTCEIIANTIRLSKTIIWNGPMGVFEKIDFQNGTKLVGLEIAKATKKGSYSLVGGGDSIAAVKLLNLYSGISYISTGGGALLDALAGKTLPGIEAIQ